MISILVPTRNRPHNIKRLCQSILDTTSNISNIEICFYIDDDDVLSLKTIELFSSNINIQCIEGETAKTGRTSMSFMENTLQKIATGPIFMYAADDIVFRTNGWDLRIVEEFEKIPDKIALIYAPDGFQMGEIPLCTHGFLHKNWIDTIGYMFPSQFDVSHQDTWLTEVSELLKRRICLKDVYIEHIHPAAGKAPWDDTYLSKREAFGGEKNLFLQSQSDRMDNVKKLQEFINNYDV